MITYYAPAERDPKTKVYSDHEKFNTDLCFKNMISAMPHVAAILNEKRQLVFSNQYLMNMLGISEMDEILSMRPGEIVNCIHSDKLEGGCGTTKNCSVCGAVNAIMESQETNHQAIKECRIRTRVDGKEAALDMLVTVTPFDYDLKKFFIFSMTDISNEKRKKALEKIFFHDIINTAGGLQGFISLLNSTDDPSETRQYLSILEGLSKDLITEIQEQQELIAAENGEMKVKVEKLNTTEVLNKVTTQIRHNDASSSKHIKLLKSDHLEFESDYNLIRRILINMLKNALEATAHDQEVSVQAKNITNNLLEFRVMNPGFMKEETQLQIFQRSFSTKGVNRGLGTYSMKLLGEQYLHGKVGFASDKNTGTQFFIRLRKKFNEDSKEID